MGISLRGFTNRSSSSSLTGLRLLNRRPPIWQTPAGSLGTIMAGTPGSLAVAATGPDPLTSYELLDGPLPAGLSFNPTTGEISGTPAGVAQDSTVDFTVRATTIHGVKADRQFSVTIQKATLPSANLFFYYNMATSGTSLLDQSGRGYNATLVGSPTVADGALTLNGTNQYIDFAGNNFNMAHPNYVGSFVFVGKGILAASVERTSDILGFSYISFNTSPSYGVSHLSYTPYSSYMPTSSLTRDPSQWTFCAISMDNPNSTYRLWIGDQSEVKTFRNPAQANTNFGYHQTLEIGRNRNYIYGTGYLAGSYRHAIHYQRALTDADITRIKATLLV